MVKRALNFGFFIFLLVASFAVEAEITLPKILGNHMVLQRNQPIPVWGFAASGEKVTVSFGNQTKTALANAQGTWKVLLNPMSASEKPSTLSVSGTNTIKLKNILVGEVWFCSGQSNMEYSMRKNSKVVKTDSSENSPIDELQWAKNPNIRIFLVTQKNMLKPDEKHEGWSEARDSALRSFSAPGYFFAKELYSKLHVPIGMISASIPGSAIEPFLAGTITSFNAQNATPLTVDESKPGKFYPTMIQPVAPFPIKGFLWYQGETNCFQNETIEYTYKMQSLINSWRKLWNDQNLPFYYVQIAPFYYSKNPGRYPLTTETEPKFWEAQQAALKIPNTAMIVTTDLVKSADDLHPGFKWEVGRRLALVALNKTYHQKITSSGPVFKSKKVKGNVIGLEFESVGKGLTSNDGEPLKGFEIAGVDGKFVPAKAVIKGSLVEASAPGISAPKEARFGWNEAGKFNFFNQDSFPAMPFRTNNALITAFKVSKNY
jgi:sialate O-acetylesterase